MGWVRRPVPPAGPGHGSVPDPHAGVGPVICRSTARLWRRRARFLPFGHRVECPGGHCLAVTQSGHRASGRGPGAQSARPSAWRPRRQVRFGGKVGVVHGPDNQVGQRLPLFGRGRLPRGAQPCMVRRQPGGRPPGGHPAWRPGAKRARPPRRWPTPPSAAGPMPSPLIGVPRLRSQHDSRGRELCGAPPGWIAAVADRPRRIKQAVRALGMGCRRHTLAPPVASRCDRQRLHGLLRPGAHLCDIMGSTTRLPAPAVAPAGASLSKGTASPPPIRSAGLLGFGRHSGGVHEKKRIAVPEEVIHERGRVGRSRGMRRRRDPGGAGRRGRVAKSGVESPSGAAG